MVNLDDRLPLENLRITVIVILWLFYVHPMAMLRSFPSLIRHCSGHSSANSPNFKASPSTLLRTFTLTLVYTPLIFERRGNSWVEQRGCELELWVCSWCSPLSVISHIVLFSCFLGASSHLSLFSLHLDTSWIGMITCITTHCDRLCDYNTLTLDNPAMDHVYISIKWLHIAP
jgi:hypothetical protein